MLRRLFRLGIRRPDITTHDVSTEIETHLCERTEHLVARGYTREAARAEALRRLGDVHDMARAALQRERSLTLGERIGAVRHDVVYAARSLRREPALTAFIAATFALGIGANAAMFGVVDRLMLCGPAHVTDANQVKRVYMTRQPAGRPPSTSPAFGYAGYAAIRDGAHVFTGVAAYKINAQGATFGRGASAESVDLGIATAGLFPLLGTHAFIGRFFTEDEDKTTGAEHVVVLGFGFWKRAYAGDRSALGKTATLNGEDYTIIGVAPEGFTGPELSHIDVWQPMSAFSTTIGGNWWSVWNAAWLNVVVRFKPGVTDQQASADLTSAFRRAYNADDSVTRAATLSARGLSTAGNGAEPAEMPVARWLMGVATIVLLIACSNVVNLLLARAIRRRREVSVRIALGAGRWRVVRLLVTESLMLSLLGGVASVAVAYGAGNLIRSLLLPQVDWATSPVNVTVLAVSAAIAIVLGVAVGLVPAMQVSRPNLASSLKSGVREGGGHAWRLRGALTVVQAALSVVLLIGAGLFVTSLARVRSLDVGVDAERVVIADIRWPQNTGTGTPESRAAERGRKARVYDEALERVRASAGVDHASLTIGFPFGTAYSLPLRVTGWDTLPQLAGGGADISAVGDEYFETVGTRIARGRAFTATDRAGSEPVAIVSELMARTLWPQRDAIGECLFVGRDATDCARIVGVAHDARRWWLREEPRMHYYVPLGQARGFSGTTLLIRPAHITSAGIAAIGKLVGELDPTVSIVRMSTLQEAVDPQVRPWRLGATVFGLMGILALIVAAVGLYSVMSYLVAQRTHEIGVRVALGASNAHIIDLVVRGGVGMAAVGVALGVVISLALGRFVSPLLFQTSATDVRVFVGAATVLIGVALAASLVPAVRARRVSPLTALRAE